MALLFSYGTLRHEQVQLELFGRKLVGHRDYLLGYEQFVAAVADPEFARMSGETHHAILRPATRDSAQVAGTALEVTDAELVLTDEYEPAGYQRVLARLASGKQAWVYVEASSVKDQE